MNKFSNGLKKSPKRESYIDLRCFDAFDAKGVAQKQKTGPKLGPVSIQVALCLSGELDR